MHGYALRELTKQYAFAYSISTHNIYPALKQLADEGLVRHHTEVVEGRARKIYDITPMGREELGRWLAEDTGDLPIVVRDPNVLKIAMLRDGTLEGARTWLVEHRARAAEEIEAAQEVLRGDVEPADGDTAFELPRYTRMVVEYGLDVVRIRVRFLDRLLALIDEDLQ